MNARHRLGLPVDRLVVVSLGAVHKWRGAIESILALEQIIERGRPADLFFVGSTTHADDEISKLVEEHDLSSRVHFTRRVVSEREWRDYLLAADLAIQLCKHPFGQISASLSDCISAGLPSVANVSVADALDAPAYVFRVPDMLAPTVVADRLAEIIESGIHETRLSPQRDEYCKGHSPEAYAHQLMKILDLQ
jgi:glycosyltransferase involved in cell wall biosynthesis